MSRISLCIVVLLTLLTFRGGLAAPLHEPAISLSPSSGEAGVGVHVEAYGFTSNQKDGAVYWDGNQVASLYIGDKGSGSADFQVPGDASEGTHKVSVQTSFEGASATFEVKTAKPAEPAVQPPYIKLFALGTDTIYAGDCTTLSWTVGNAEAVIIYGDFGSQGVDTTGSLKVCPSKTTTYQINVNGYKGANPDSVSGQVVLTVLYTVTNTPHPTPTDTPTPSPTPTVTPTPTNTPTVLPGVSAFIPIFIPPYSMGCRGLTPGPLAHTITFDDQPVGSLSNAYPGVDFRGSAFIAVPPVAPHSGAQGLGSFFEEGMGSFSRPIQMVFSQPMHYVGLYVGRSEPSSYATGSINATLSVYGTDTTGNTGMLGQDLVVLPGSATPINRCLQVTAPAGTAISHAVLDFSDGLGHSIYDRRWVDDVTIEAASGTHPDNPPTVRIISPRRDEIDTSDSLTLEVTATDDYGVQGLALSINGAPLHSIPFTGVVSTEPPQVRSLIWLSSELRQFATNTLRVVATDTAHQTGEATVSFQYRPSSRLDLTVTGVEITQVEQCFGEAYVYRTCADNSIPIYRGKMTLVREYVHIASGPGTLANVDGVLCPGTTGERGCGDPVHSIAPINLGADTNNIYPARYGWNRTINFIVPSAWMDGGALTLTAYVNYNQANYAENNYGNNFRTATVPLHDPKMLDVDFVAMDVSGINADLNQRWAIARGLELIYPIDYVQVWESSRGRLSGTWNLADSSGSGCHSGWESALNSLWWYNAWTDDGADWERYQGLVNPSVPKWDGEDGCGNTPGDESMIIMDGNEYNFLTSGHELGHNHGLQHAPAGGAANPDPGYPVSGGLVDFVGVDIPRHRVMLSSNTVDLMGYSGFTNKWISRYTYNNLYNDVQAVAGIFSGQSSRTAGLAIVFPKAQLALRSSQQTPVSYVAGSGKISPSGFQLDSGLQRLTPAKPLVDSLPPGPYIMELQDAAGNPLTSRNFGPLTSDTVAPTNDTGNFEFFIPWVDQAAALVIKYKDVEIGRIAASKNPPTVTVLSPNGGESWASSGEEVITWNASDPDGDPLTYAVQYSPDGGITWQALGVNLTEMSLKIDLADIPGSQSALVRVTASDGFNSTSDVSDAAFMVPVKGPDIYLASPEEGGQYFQQAPVVLEAMGTDRQDGPLQNAAFTWKSDRDGSLGSGRSLIVASLSVGDHTITLTGTNSAGLFTTRMVHIHIGDRLVAVNPAMGRPSILPFFPAWAYWAADVLLVLLLGGGITLLILMLKRNRKKG